MDKATPTPSPASVDSFMSLLRNHENRISETYGVLQDRRIPSEEVRAAIDASWEARNALIAEVERLAAQAAPTERAPVVQATWPQEVQPDGTVNAVDPADMGASSGAAQAAPFAKDSWQHAVDNQLVAFGRTSQEFANPHEALAWLAIVNMELGQSNVGAAQAVRVLTREELNDVALSEKVGWGPGEYVEAVQRKFAEVNGLRIPADGKIGDAA